MKTINVIGCGNVGKTLCRLWTRHGVFRVQSVLNRSLESSRQAVRFIDAGAAVENYAEMKKADVVMISASDEAVGLCSKELCRTNLVSHGVAVFHCSGSLSSAALEPAAQRGAWVASIHPVRSFADTASSVKNFSGTFCALEGDPEACEVLRDAMHRCGAITFPVQPDAKPIYHAATVIVCNYLVALMEVGLRCFQKAGIARETAGQIMQPIVRETMDNVFKLGTVQALTGPIARGEPSVVASQCEALAQWDEEIHRVYRALGRAAAELSAAQGNATPQALAAINKILQS